MPRRRAAGPSGGAESASASLPLLSNWCKTMPCIRPDVARVNVMHPLPIPSDIWAQPSPPSAHRCRCAPPSLAPAPHPTHLSSRVMWRMCCCAGSLPGGCSAKCATYAGGGHTRGAQKVTRGGGGGAGSSSVDIVKAGGTGTIYRCTARHARLLGRSPAATPPPLHKAALLIARNGGQPNMQGRDTEDVVHAVWA